MNLDHQYDTRAWAPDYLATLERHKRLGEAVRRRADARLDVPWGAGARQKLDQFGDGSSLALFIHGGYWQYRTSTKESVSFLAPPFLERGIAFCAVGYELCPDLDMDAMVRQLQQALAFVRKRRQPERVVVLGHSAGGHLAAMLALTSDGIAGAVGVSGLYDLEPLVRTYLNEALGLDAESARRNSPMHLNNSRRGGLVLAVGALESPEFKRQSEAFARASGARLHELRGKDHYAATESLLEPGALQEDVMGLFH